LTDSIHRPGSHTLAEMFSEPETWRNCLVALDLSGELRNARDSFPSEGPCVFIGCGSSFYLALIAASTWSIWTGEDARAVPASEILFFPRLLPRAIRPILISRSGRTSETIEAGNYLKAQNRGPALAVTCEIGSPIERVAELVMRLPQADEKSTVMTRSFSSMLLALQMLAAERAGQRAFADGLWSLPNETQPLLTKIDSTIQRLVNSQTFEDYVFLGQGPFYGVAQESMLKVKEMSCSYAQCFHTLEFRHGPKAIVGPEMLVTFFLSESGFDSEVSVLQEIKDLGATTLVITNKSNAAVRESADYLLELPFRVPEPVRAAAFVIPGQLLGFHTGIRKGLDPDNPRNLSRVVMLQNGSDGGSSRGAA
jgi:glutamine---fructose-6-phosphate transaminase (isomerizing)